MPTHRHLSPAHQQTLDAIFRHHGGPADVTWADLMHLIEAVGSVRQKSDGVYQLLVNGEHHEFRRPTHDAITNADELATLRRFLERAHMTP